MKTLKALFSETININVNKAILILVIVFVPLIIIGALIAQIRG